VVALLPPDVTGSVAPEAGNSWLAWARAYGHLRGGDRSEDVVRAAVRGVDWRFGGSVVDQRAAVATVAPAWLRGRAVPGQSEVHGTGGLAGLSVGRRGARKS